MKRSCTWPLELCSFLWRAGVRIDRFSTRSHRLAKPVISVGNITFGGTGKTPFVIYLAQRLVQKGITPAVLTRGYRSRGDQRDEPGLLSDALPDVPVCVSPDRRAAAVRCLAAGRSPDVFLLDDGFQHWALQRDLDIVLLDALKPFGSGRVCPAGILREDVDSLARAHAAVITRADLVPGRRRDLIMQYLLGRFPGLAVGTAGERIVRFTALDGTESNTPKGQVFAVCGIGNPESFFLRIESGGCGICGTRIFSDHYRWNEEAVERVEEEAEAAGAVAIVTTAKDANKISPQWTGKTWAVMEIVMEMFSGEDALLDSCFRVIGMRNASRGGLSGDGGGR